MQWNFTLWADLFQWKFFSLMKNVVQLYCLSSLQIETLSQQYSNPRMPPVICCLCSNVSALNVFPLHLRSWKMKLCTKKIRQMLGSFQNLIAGDTRSLVRQKSQEKYLCQPYIGLLHQDHLPAKRCSRLQRCVKPGLWISVMYGLKRQEYWTGLSLI